MSNLGDCSFILEDSVAVSDIKSLGTIIQYLCDHKLHNIKLSSATDKMLSGDASIGELLSYDWLKDISRA